MTTGAIFARGSCRALKWMALVGVVFALAAAQAAAQAPVLKVEPSGTTPGSVTLTWTYSGGPAPVSPYWRTQTAASTVVLTNAEPNPANVTGATGTTRSVDLVPDDTGEYVYRVAVVTSGDTNVWSNQVVFQTEAAPGAPTALMATVGDGMVTLKWTAPTGNVNHYEYAFKSGATATAIPADDTGWKVVPGGGSARSVTITTGLTNGKSYYFSVRTVNNGGKTPVAATEVAVPSTKPGAPTEVTPTLGTPVSSKVHVDLTWTAPESDGGNAIKYYEYMYGAIAWKRTPGAATTVRIPNLDPAMAAEYTYYVRAVNDNGAGPIGDSMGGTGGTGPGPGTTPAGPTDGRISSITIGGPGDVELKTIGGVRRVHVKEGQVVTANVGVTWTHKMVADLWDQAHPDRPPDVTVDLMVTSVIDPATWLSPAENDQKPGLSNRSGYDVSLGAGRGGSNRVTIRVPDRRRDNPTSEAHFVSSSGSTTLSLNPDLDAEDEAFTLQTVAGSGNGVYLGSGPLGASLDRLDNDTSTSTRVVDVAVIEDVDVQGVKLTRDPTANRNAVFEGGSVLFKAVADPPREDLQLQVRYYVTNLDGVSVSSREYTLDSAVGNIPVGHDPNVAKHNVTFSTPANDKNREDVDFTLHAEVISYDLASGAFDDIQSDTHAFTVFDMHKLPILKGRMVTPSASTVKEGEIFTLKVEIDRNPANTMRVGGEQVSDYTREEVTVAFSTGAGSAGVKDYEIMTNPVTFPKLAAMDPPGIQMMEVEVKALEDADLDDMEVLVLDVEIDGTNTEYGPNTDMDEYPGAASVTIEDATAKTVSAKTQAEVEAAVTAAGLDEALTVGDAVMIMGSALFDAMPGASVIYSATSSDMTVASTSESGGEITVMAKRKGDAMITIAASAEMGSGVTINDQTTPGRATIDIPVSVALSPLSVELMGPDAGMNLIEGMEYTITAKANRAVEMDTMVELMQTDGTASPADYEVEPITIKMGSDIGTTKLMVKDDGLIENEGNMTETLTLEGRVGAMKTTNSLMFYLWDEAVPALPVIAQFLLAALMAVGGYRRYRRR